ncbi:DUF3017 domain-containing protein [Streptomyces syringium]|uniref:DUF3017 domain-containing protein n=1 Tax=Streptomyces syringium TaxID=76729 RepID=UPI0033EBBEC7
MNGAASSKRPESGKRSEAGESAAPGKGAGVVNGAASSKRPEAGQASASRRAAATRTGPGGRPGSGKAPEAAEGHGPGPGKSRRFQAVTRDTARPEGGGRAAPGDAPAPARQWPLLAVLGATGLGLLLVAFDAFRVGTLLIGLAMIGGAALRWALPSVGMLAVRSRFTDMFTYGGLGVAIVLLALMAQPKAWLKIPFLDDILHFTVR